MIIEQQFADLENWIFTGYLYRSHRPKETNTFYNIVIMMFVSFNMQN